MWQQAAVLNGTAVFSIGLDNDERGGIGIIQRGLLVYMYDSLMVHRDLRPRDRAGFSSSRTAVYRSTQPKQQRDICVEGVADHGSM